MNQQPASDTQIPAVKSQDELKKQLVQDVLSQLRAQESSILKRNVEIDKRYNALYGTGLTDGLAKPKDFDDTQLNYVRLVPEIMTNQLFGRGFTVRTTYNKEDLSVYDLPAASPEQEQQNKQEKDQAKQLNGRRKVDAGIRDNAIRGMFIDNGDIALWNRAGKMQSYAGFVGIQHYYDADEQKYRIIPLENPNNIWVAWASNNFREYDWIAYVDKISYSSANRKYNEYLGEGESFLVAAPGGSPWQYASQEDQNDMPQKEVWRISLSGYLPHWEVDDKGKLTKADKPGDETEVGITIVGDKLCHVRTKNVPRYELVNNSEDPGRPYGVSDVTDSAISINRTLIQVARSWFTLGFKSAFYKIIAKGFTSVNIPQSTPLTTEFLPVDLDQDFKLLDQPQGFPQLQQQLEALIQAFTRVTRIGMVMFNDPAAISNSNQAMMTGMKPLIDVVEEKQGRWNIAIKSIVRNALQEIADDPKMDKALKEAITADPTWEPMIEWPSILRKEDAAWQSMWLNLKNAGIISWSTAVEKLGPQDTSEELDRMRDDLEDPVRAAALAGSLQEIASWTINKAKGIPPWGYVVPKVQLRGDLTPQQEANMAQNYGWQDGPYGGSIGPQGFEGTQANDNFINAGQLAPGSGGVNGDVMPAHAQASTGPNQQPTPVAQPDQNQPGTQPVSQPGSGAPAVTPQGNLNQTNQRQGK